MLLEYFKFNLYNNINSNYFIFVNIVYIDNSQFNYVIDKNTKYQATR